MTTILVENFTDPACPWAWSAEPALLALRWRYGDALEIVPRMVGLSERGEDYLAKGFTPDRLAAGLTAIAARFGMPIDTRVRPRMVATIVACRAVVAARRHDAEAADRLLRLLRVLGMAGELTDEPATLRRAAIAAGLDPDDLGAWTAEPETEAELRADMDAARHPLPPALALDHKLAPWDEGRRYTCPSLVLRRDGRDPVVAPGFQPAEAYEVLLANLAPELDRRAAPESVEELLEWAPWPLATREVAAVCELDVAEARQELARIAGLAPVGADGFWSLREVLTAA